MFIVTKGSAERSAEGFGFPAERSVVWPNLKMKVRSYTSTMAAKTVGQAKNLCLSAKEESETRLESVQSKTLNNANYLKFLLCTKKLLY